VFQQLAMQLALPAGSSTLWWLLDFRAEAGCSGFSVGASCSNCLTGFYPALTAGGYPNGCPLCPQTCATCTSSTVCLTCQPYATFNASSQTCYYPSSYLIYNTSAAYTPLTGTLMPPTTYLNPVYSSLNQQLNLALALQNNQSYFLQMVLLYPASYITNSANFSLAIDGNNFQANNLNLNLGTLSPLNNAQSQLYLLPVTINRMGSSGCQANGHLQVQVGSTNIFTD
jgi:hypothetical protein